MSLVKRVETLEKKENPHDQIAKLQMQIDHMAKLLERELDYIPPPKRHIKGANLT